MRTGSPHDRLVKAVFSLPRFAAQLLPLARNPARLAGLDPATLVQASSEAVDEALQARIPDLLFRVARRDARGRRALLLLEHSSKGWRWVMLRLLRDARAALECERRSTPGRRLPPVFPLVLFPGPGPWRWPLSMREILEGDPEDPTLGPLLQADVVELACHEPSALRALPGPALGRLALVTLKCAREGGDLCQAWRDAEAVVEAALAEEDGTEALTELFVYAEQVLGEVAMGKLRDQTERRHGESARRGFATAGERLLAEGAERQARETLEGLLTIKFGPLAPGAVAKLGAASLDELNHWTKRILSASRIEDVFGAATVVDEPQG